MVFGPYEQRGWQRESGAAPTATHVHPNQCWGSAHRGRGAGCIPMSIIGLLCQHPSCGSGYETPTEASAQPTCSPHLISQLLFPPSPDPADSHGETHQGLWGAWLGGISVFLQAGREQKQLFASKQIPRLCLGLGFVFFSSLKTPACGHKCQEPSSKLQLIQGGISKTQQCCF